MNAIKVKKDVLLDTLRKNRENHRKIFLEAQDGYRAQVIKELDGMLKDAREGKKIRRMIRLSEPQDQTKDYDRVIRMLELSEDETILLSEIDFAQYVLDDWHWKASFLASNSVYSASATHELESYSPSDS